MLATPANRYVVIPPRSSTQIGWNPFDPDDLPVPDCAYIGGVLTAMEQHSAISGLTFYITSNLERLPSYGEHVVAIVLSDEWCRIPRYAFDVRAIFKTYGTKLAINWGAFARPTPYQLAALAQDLRTATRRFPSLLSAARRYTGLLVRGKKPTWRIYTIPLGFFHQVAVPFVPVEQRRFDVYFAGSFTNKSAQRPLDRITPKYLSRAAMLERLRRLSLRFEKFAVVTTLTAGFLDTTDDQVTQYSKAMMETKICLVPRGTSLETYRYFEGLRFGCVVVTERLPDHWFYDGSPAIRVKSWAELDRLVPALLADPVRLEKLSRESLSWWSDRCSERAVGVRIAEVLRGAGEAA